MKILLVHAKDFSYEVKSKAIPGAEENIDERKHIHTQNTLVVFTSIEQDDCTASPEQLSNIAQDICSHTHNIKARSIVLYPYAHLSSNLAKPECALRVLKNLEIALREICTDVSVLRAPFGWYKSFQITCYGHPLSELSREYRIGSASASLKPSELIEQLKCEILLKEENDLRLLEPGTAEYVNAINLLEQLMGTRKDTLDRGYMGRVRLLASKFGVLNQNFLGKGEVIVAEIRRLNEKVIQRVGGITTLSKVMSLGSYTVTRERLGTDLHALCSSVYFNMKESGIINDAESKALLTEVSWIGDTVCGRGGDPLSSDTAPIFIQVLHDASKALSSAVDIINIVAEVLTKCIGIEIIAVVTGKKNIVKEVLSKLRLARAIGVACNANNGDFFEIALTTALGKTRIPLTSVTLLSSSDSSSSVAIASTLTGPFLRLIYTVFSNALQMMDSGKTPYIPACVSPVQVRVIPVKPEHRDYAEKVRSRLVNEGIRADIDARNIGLGRRIRDAGKEWVPYIVVVGDREVLSGTVNVRMRAEGIQRSMSVDDLVRIVKTTCPYIYE